MKRILVCMTVLMFFAAITTSLSASDKKEINLFGNIGLAASDVEGFFFDVGAELQLSNSLYAQFLFDYYFNPSGEDLEGVNDSAYGFNLYGVYKSSRDSSLRFFAKAGVHYTTIKVGASYEGISISAESSDFGIGGGIGLEFGMGESIALVLGGTAKLIFTEGDTGTWFKFYGGVNFTVN